MSLDKKGKLMIKLIQYTIIVMVILSISLLLAIYHLDALNSWVLKKQHPWKVVGIKICVIMHAKRFTNIVSGSWLIILTNFVPVTII
jgi:hypothetical protein